MNDEYIKTSFKQNNQLIQELLSVDALAHLKSALSKIIDPIQNPKIKQRWIAYTDNLLPKNSLGYKTNDEYLKQFNLTQEEIIKNTILSIFPDKEGVILEDLIEDFKIFADHSTILIYHQETPVKIIYREIHYVLLYIKKVLDVSARNEEIKSSSHHGTKKSTKPNELIHVQIRYLKDKLDHPYFPIVNRTERKRVNYQISFLKDVLKDETKSLHHLYNAVNIYFGLDYPMYKINKEDQQTITQLLSLINGVKTSYDEFVASAMIYMREQVKKVSEKDHELLASSILSIAKHFFNNVFLTSESKRPKRPNQLTYNEEHINKPVHIKTFIDECPVFTYTYKNSYDFLLELMSLFFDALQMENNNPLEYSTTKLPSVNAIFDEFGFTQEEVKAYKAYLDIISQDS